MFETFKKDMKKPKIVAVNPLEKQEAEQLLDLLRQSESVVVKWRTQPSGKKDENGKEMPMILYDEIQVSIKNDADEYVRLFDISVSDKVPVPAKIRLDDIKKFIKQEPATVVSLINKKSSARQKYNKVFYNQLMACMRQKEFTINRPYLITGGQLFKNWEESGKLFDKDKQLLNIYRNKEGVIVISILDKEHKIDNLNPEYTIKIKPEDAIYSKLPELKTVLLEDKKEQARINKEEKVKWLNSTDLIKAFKDEAFQPTITNIKIQPSYILSSENDPVFVKEFTYSAQKQQKQELQNQESKELINDDPFGNEPEMVDRAITIKLKK